MTNNKAHAHRIMRLRVQGALCIIQPYVGESPSDQSLCIDLKTGAVSIENPTFMKDDYVTVYAIVGMLQLPSGTAVAAVTSAHKAATVARCPIYRATGTRVFIAEGGPPLDANSTRLLQLFKLGVNPSGSARGLYYSAEYNVTTSQQRLHATPANQPLGACSTPDFFWNEALVQPIQDTAGAERFVVPCILGFVRQIEGARLEGGSKTEVLSITVIARRSKRRAGTRHWRRGADLEGAVANVVESEQIIESESGHFSAHVQLRGSIPLCWSQVPNTKYKPTTAIADCSGVSRQPFRAHAASLADLYGHCIAINLANQHGTEGRLGADFQTLATAHERDINFSLVAFDFHKECGATNYKNIDKLWEALSRDFATFGTFEMSGEAGQVRRRQTGVLRTNCIDCLDRTNVLQGYLARKALESVCRGLALLPRHASLSDFPSLEQQFKILWADHGDMISRQYAGTGALKSGFTRTGKRTLGGLVDDGLKSVVRYYLNNYEDGIKQDSIDLVTGAYVPTRDLRKGSVPFKKHASGAIPVLLAIVMLLISLQCFVTAPFSRRVTLYHAFPPFVAALLLAGVVHLLGRSATCRPQLLPDAAQPWLKAGAPTKTLPGVPEAGPKPFKLT